MHALVILCSLVVATWAQGSTPNIVDYLTSRRYTQIVSLLKTAGLTDTLKGDGPFTVFAPSDRAFRNLDAAVLGSLQNDTAKLAAVLKYHVVSGIHKAADINYNELQLDSLQGSKIRMNHYLSVGGLTAEGQRIISPDHVVSNGVVHLMNGVMMPPSGTVVDIVSNDGELTTLLAAVQKAGLTNFLQDQHPITVFAPTDKAFADLGSDVVGALINNPTLLTSILKYHVIPGTLYKAGYHSTSLDTFEEADRIRLHRFIFSYEVDDGTLDKVELSALNGVVHKIDKVLIPSSLSDQVKALTAGATTTTP
ncbi:transforming growth factor-beta-induced protein ig-h3-like [Haliotis cracherodii]|uniref:transforming growth factor-beta-induced protein ig-h3-like n=1 Tax=Haliotis cracherodii TaxID=6455 RepID=UPI0039ED224A